jgi:toxin YoeB
VPLKPRLSGLARRQMAGMAKRQPEALERVVAVIADVLHDPFSGLHKPEPLKFNLSGWWSVRLDQKNRVVYRVAGRDLFIASVEGHYDQR